MQSRWTQIRALSCFGIALAFAGAAAFSPAAGAQPVLSNRIPIALLRQLQQEFRIDPDQLPTAEAADFAEFWSAFESANSDPEIVVDRLFGTANDPASLAGRFPSLYPAKFAVLRYLQQHNKDGAKGAWIAKTMQAWQKRYIAIALAGIELSGIKEYEAIVLNFRDRLKKNEVHLIDLSPAERERWAQQYAKDPFINHNETILARDSSGRYLVQGRFQPSTGYLAVDFGRPVAESLVSFGHEVVHAGDHELNYYLGDYLRQVQESKALLYAACDRVGLKYWKSDANFVLVCAGDRLRALVKGAADRGIYIRDRSSEPGCAGCLRIATGVIEHTRRFIAAMEEVLCAAP